MDNHITSYVKVIEKYIELKQDKKDSYLKEENGKVVISFARKDGNKEIALTRNDNNKLYDLLVKQTGKKIYKGLAIGNIINSKLSSSFEIFNNLEVMQQAEVLYNIIKSLTTDASCSDMRLLQDSPNVGKIYINKDITDKDIKVIYRSCTGLIQKEVRI